jgi:hypothetical protein
MAGYVTTSVVERATLIRWSDSIHVTKCSASRAPAATEAKVSRGLKRALSGVRVIRAESVSRGRLSVSLQNAHTHADSPESRTSIDETDMLTHMTASDVTSKALLKVRLRC